MLITSTHRVLMSCAMAVTLIAGIGLGLFSDSGPVTLAVKNGARVYFPADLSTGDKVEKSKPAVISSRKVFDATPEYAEIRRRALDANSAEHALLVNRASDRFKAAVTSCVDRGGYDLIAEHGAVSVETGELPDVTDEVIKGL